MRELPFLWEDWIDSMRDRGVTIPSKITFRHDQDTEIDCETRGATLDQLASAIVFLEDEIERLLDVKAGLLAIQRRAHRICRPGDTRVNQALGFD